MHIAVEDFICFFFLRRQNWLLGELLLYMTGLIVTSRRPRPSCTMSRYSTIFKTYEKTFLPHEIKYVTGKKHGYGLPFAGDEGVYSSLMCVLRNRSTFLFSSVNMIGRVINIPRGPPNPSDRCSCACVLPYRRASVTFRLDNDCRVHLFYSKLYSFDRPLALRRCI